MNGFHAVGLGLEILGAIFLRVYSKKTSGILTHDIVEHYSPSWWLDIGIILVVFGFLSQATGLFFG
jgi:hypothetical protein